MFSFQSVFSQLVSVRGHVTSNNEPIVGAKITFEPASQQILTDSIGSFEFFTNGKDTLSFKVSAFGYEPFEQMFIIGASDVSHVHIELKESTLNISEVVVSGTMREVSKMNSPIPIEIYTATFFRANPNASIFESLQQINGVRPQVNCNICATGDIHINGLEGPYTMILIDGMPLVSGLSTVYGLNGIPQALIERVEIVKGPASTLYGSEAVGGLINIITKSPTKAPLISVDVFGTSLGELSADVSTKFRLGPKTQSLIGINYFNYNVPVDYNKDGFTDATLQDRISVFNKWNFQRKDNRVFSIAARYVYEDRWGGDMRWNKRFRGGDSIYGESIYTNRWELFGLYQLPVKERLFFQFSSSGHYQNSVYGNMHYSANQTIGFGQLYWQKSIRRHELLIGATYRYTYFDDNTPATATMDSLGVTINRAQHMHLPGFFAQDVIQLNEKNQLLVGARYDYNFIHGHILSPRINYKWNASSNRSVFRLGFGNGYRVANVFTEDHAALTGARKVVFANELKPETSWNGTANFVQQFALKSNNRLELDASLFYTHFGNKIIPDYTTNSNEIRYDNLKGYAISQGASFSIDFVAHWGLSARVGATLMDVSVVNDGVKSRQMFSERFTATWTIGYSFSKLKLKIDYTGNVYSPMKLPLLGELDPRDDFSPWWSIQNIQVTKTFKNGLEVYGGVKNLLNWRPDKNGTFLIARPHDPFDKNVQFDGNGNAVANAENPYALTFDPAYVYAPNQGIRGFLGIRWFFD